MLVVSSFNVAPLKKSSPAPRQICDCQSITAFIDYPVRPADDCCKKHLRTEIRFLFGHKSCQHPISLIHDLFARLVGYPRRNFGGTVQFDSFFFFLSRRKKSLQPVDTSFSSRCTEPAN